ncbi:hypothetical protein fugu_010842 [Takifugu bimaculatus]|uniref:Colorectal cancer-associated protein 2 n=3 Tax=Takifugu TaxID=31032 RepID=A0A5C6PGQ9_9TELE|nr:hypothetical protein fugu_010842 [Takifugu bimaculatus]TWW77838.1 hypothetical protein D4764_12G0012280 [Takifugu flavidus]
MQDGVFADFPQSGDRVLPAGDHCGGDGGLEGGGGGYGGSASPWCHGLSSDADYYGPAMAACSSPESLKFCNPADPSCYSPQDSFSSSSSSSCYDSPTRMESGYGGFASEHFHHPHCNLQDCCCLSPRWPAQQEAFSIPDHTPYYTPTEYPYACPVEENYFRRDLSMGSEMCYNLL